MPVSRKDQVASNQSLLQAMQEMGKLEIISVELPVKKSVKIGDKVKVEDWSGEYTVTWVGDAAVTVEQLRHYADGDSYAVATVDVAKVKVIS